MGVKNAFEVRRTEELVAVPLPATVTAGRQADHYWYGDSIN
jgi:hypothetical protein